MTDLIRQIRTRAEDRRGTKVRVYLTSAEVRRLDEVRGPVSRSTYLRGLLLSAMPYLGGAP